MGRGAGFSVVGVGGRQVAKRRVFFSLRCSSLLDGKKMGRSTARIPHLTIARPVFDLCFV